MNPFDAVVTAAVVLGVVLGFMSGLVRSLATILAYLIGSKLRSYLSAAGQQGLASLPPEAEDYIDRLKGERGL